MMAPPDFPYGCLDGLSNPDTRDVLKDWHIAHDVPLTFGDAADADADVDADAAADVVDDDADADAADAADVDDDADAAAVADADVDVAAVVGVDSHVGVDSDADDAAATDVDVAAVPTSQVMECYMEPGLYILRLRGGWGGRGIPYVGWLVPHRGDWWHLIGARRISRRNNDLTALQVLAAKGPSANHVLDPASDVIEVVHIMNTIMRRYHAAPLWEEYCPRPADWNVP